MFVMCQLYKYCVVFVIISCSAISSIAYSDNWTVDAIEAEDEKLELTFRNWLDNTTIKFTPRYWYGSEIKQFIQFEDWLVAIFPANSTADNIIIVNWTTGKIVEELGFHVSISPNRDRIVYEKFFPRFMPKEVPRCAEVLEIRLSSDLAPQKHFPLPELFDTAHEACKCQVHLPVTWKPDGSRMAFWYSCPIESDEESAEKHWTLIELYLSPHNADRKCAIYSSVKTCDDSGKIVFFNASDLAIDWNEKGRMIFRLSDGTVVDISEFLVRECGGETL